MFNQFETYFIYNKEIINNLFLELLSKLKIK